MADQGEHIVLKCSGADCGMRYPSPADDPRRDACPLCESPVSEVGRFASPPEHAPPRPAETTTPLVAVLDSIRSALNVGAMIRSADGAGLDHVYLCGLTAPVDNPKVRKTALGAEQSVASTSLPDVVECVQQLKTQGYQIWSIDYSPESVPLQSIDALPDKTAFVLGNERAGVDPAVLGLSDRHVHLDMHGAKSTLNVGVAFGIVAYWLDTVRRRTNRV